MGMPVPEHSSPVNEQPGLLLPVDNSKGEVLKIRAAAVPELFTNAVVKCLTGARQA
jgi:hypothetical protein